MLQKSLKENWNQNQNSKRNRLVSDWYVVAAN